MPKRRKSSEQTLDQSFRLKKISPMTDTQSDVFDAYYENFNLFLYGCAGTGKTYISLYLALKEVLNPNSPYRKVYVVRSAVPSRDMGFMPGKLSDKMAVYESPYISMVNDLFGRGDAYEITKFKGVFEMVSTSFLRGMTFENCILIVDEVENLTFQELDTTITRLGNNVKLLMCGDINQCDLIRSKFDTSGMAKFMKIIESMEAFDLIEFKPEDIVRSNLVKNYILFKLKYESNQSTHQSTLSSVA